MIPAVSRKFFVKSYPTIIIVAIHTLLSRSASHGTVVKVSPETVLIGAVSESQHYDFVMCNPPFYTDKKDRCV